MGYLKIKTRAQSTLNPKFIETFIAISEEEAHAPITMTAIDAFLHVTDANHQENIDIQNMATFLLLSNEVMAVKWNEAYYFGDVDRMDSEVGFNPSAETVTMLQYTIDFEEKLFLCAWGSGYSKVDQEAIVEEHTLDFFSTDNGYRPGVGAQLDSLELGRSLDLSDMTANHSIIRIK